MALSTSIRNREVAHLQPSAASTTPIDLAITQQGWLLRTFRRGADIWVERSVDAGKTWGLSNVVSTLGASSVPGGAGAAPTLCVDRFDGCFCWFHDSAGFLRAFYARPGRYDVWEAFATSLHIPFVLYYPRMALREDVAWLVAHNGTHALLYAATDYGALLGSPVDQLECPVQLLALRVDRRGTLHEVHRTASGALSASWRADQGGDDFSSVVQLAPAGQYPAFACGTERALLVYWDGGTLRARVTDETYAADGGAVNVPTGDYQPSYTGLIWDGADRVYWVAQAAAGSLETRWTENQGQEWEAVT